MGDIDIEELAAIIGMEGERTLLMSPHNLVTAPLLQQGWRQALPADRMSTGVDSEMYDMAIDHMSSISDVQGALHPRTD